MAITNISRIQHRRGILADLPSDLNEGELGFTLDTHELFIGNGPTTGGNTPILTGVSPIDQITQHKWQLAAQNIQSSVSRKLASKLDDIASVRDFGALGDGVTDDAPAINAAIVELFGKQNIPGNLTTSRHVSLYLPAGVYLLNSPLLLGPGVSLRGDGAGNTVLLAGNNSMPCVINITDSAGAMANNIGGSGGTPPNHIRVCDLSISTNSFAITAVELWSYQGVHFDGVEIDGGFTGSGTVHSGVSINAGLTLIPTTNFSFTNGIIRRFTYGILTQGVVSNTVVSHSSISHCQTGVQLGMMAGAGASNTRLMAVTFSNILDYGVLNLSTSSGLVSMGCTFMTCGTNIEWGTGTNQCASIGDVFDKLPGVVDLGSNNFILDALQSNVPTGPTGPTGIQGIQGPTGTTGSTGASTTIPGSLIVNSATTITQFGIYIEATGGNYTIALPSPVGIQGATYTIWLNTILPITLSTPAGVFVGPNGSGVSSSVLIPVISAYYLVTADGTNWVSTAIVPASSSASLGDIKATAATVAPAKWYFCYGQAVSRVTFASLYASIGTSWGAGDGSTTFNLPDFRGRTLAGLDNMGGSAANRLTSAVSGINAIAIGAVGGDQNIFAHNHGTSASTIVLLNDTGHNHSASTSLGFSDPGHSHGVYDPTHAHGVYDPQHSHTLNSVVDNTGYTDGFKLGTFAENTGIHNGQTYSSATNIGIYGAGTGIGIYGSGTGITFSPNTAINKNTTGITVKSSTTSVTVNNSGTGVSQNVQPTAVVNWLIYAGV